MNLLCISSSNVLHKKQESASTRVCDLVAEIARTTQGAIHTETLRLVDYPLSNCIFCGQCKDNQRCVLDEDFNRLYQKLIESDRIVLVVPFYSVIPSKLTLILEKLNQLFYTAWLKNPDAVFALPGKKIVIIGHGGSVLHDNPGALDTYRSLLLKPLDHVLSSLGFEVVALDDTDSRGALFGVKGYSQREDAIFPDMVHDWVAIKDMLIPWVHKLIA